MMNTMRAFNTISVLALCASATLTAQAAPTMVTTLRPTAQTYAVYFLNQSIFNTSAKLSVVKSDITSQLAPLGLLPCFETTADLNATDLRCGSDATGGQMQLGINELFSYSLETLLKPELLAKNANNNNLKGVTQQYVANFIAPNPLVPTAPFDTQGRVARIHFTARMAQFGFQLDPGVFGTLNTIQFIVNGQALPPQTIAPNGVQFVGVEDPHGFTDLSIVGGGGAAQGSKAAQSFVSTRLAFLPLTKF